MSTNCLVTKLKTVVDNDNIPYFGLAKILVAPSNSSQSIRVNTPNIRCKILGGTFGGNNIIGSNNTGYIHLSGSDAQGKIISPDGAYGNRIAVLVPKYEISQINLRTGGEVDAEELKWSKEFLTRFELRGASIRNASSLNSIFKFAPITNLIIQDGTSDEEFSVSDLGSTETLTMYSIAGNTTNLKVTGSLDKLGCSPLSGFDSPGPKSISMSIENFVAYNRAFGRTTGSINLRYVGACNATFNGASVVLAENNNLSWDATTITFRGTTIDA